MSRFNCLENRKVWTLENFLENKELIEQIVLWFRKLYNRSNTVYKYKVQVQRLKIIKPVEVTPITRLTRYTEMTKSVLVISIHFSWSVLVSWSLVSSLTSLCHPSPPPPCFCVSHFLLLSFDQKTRQPDLETPAVELVTHYFSSHSFEGQTLKNVQDFGEGEGKYID